ncbi:MAG: HAMP domain-containing histidine kinase [Clostridiales bacterium]|nr:HAMP domain-containing histidine kinase [Clostridiales bacterium]
MKNKKRNIVPKKKAIKKPKFIKYFATWLAIFLVISMTASYFVIGVCRQTAKTTAISKWNNYTQELSRLMNDYCSADEDVREEYLDRVKDFLCRYAEDMNDYCAVYVDNEKLLETPAGTLASVSVIIEEETESAMKISQSKYFLEDQSYLEPLYKAGFDPARDAYITDVYSVENTTLKEFARKLGLLPTTYSFSWKSIYVNEDTHKFLPGEAIINEYVDGEPVSADDENVKTIDCTPKDTKGYRLLKYYYEDGAGVDIGNELNGYFNPALTDINNAASITNDPTDISYSDTASVMPWEILTVSAEDYSNKACFKVLPLTTAFVLSSAVLVSLLLAITVSTILYSSKKTVWEIFEYRKKTTAAMAHDLKTPLAAMSAYAENLEYDIDSEKRAYYSGKVRENVAFMNKTIESILMFTKSESGTAKSVSRDIDVRALLEDEYNAVAKLFEDKNIKVEIKGEGHVKSNKELIDQAVRNLIGNAAKYTRKDTTLDIAIDNKGFTMTNLTDQKIKNVNDLKKPFVKGEESRDAEGGAGLGLSIVENCLLSAGHNLDIEFEDETFKAVVRW